MLVQDPYTGEWVEEEELDYQPLNPSRAELNPENVRTGKMGSQYYDEAPWTPPPKPPPPTPEPSFYNGVPHTGQRGNMGEYDPETDARIEGYGKRLMLRKAGQTDWLTPGGAIASPDYVQDVQSTMRDLDEGRMSETQLREKIKGQEGIPPGRKPTDGEINIVDFVNFHMAEKEPELRAQAKEARTKYEASVSYTTKALMKTGVLDAKATQVEEQRYNELRNEEKALVTKHAERLQKLEDAKKKDLDVTPKNQMDLAIRTLRETLKREPTGTEITDYVRKQAGDTAQSNAEATQRAKDLSIDIGSLAKAVGDGQDAPIAIKGAMGNPVATKVKSSVLALWPKFDFMLADANYKWKQSATNMRTINFVGGSLPRLGALDDQLKKLPNVDINIINKVMATVSKEFGKPEYTNYESNRNAIVQEINTALSGTSQSSDMRIKIELDNLKSARSPSQIAGAIDNLRMALEARLDVDLSPLYPLDVVRGLKSINQYKKELYQQYRGDYKPHFGQGTENIESVKSKPTRDEIIAELRRRGKM